MQPSHDIFCSKYTKSKKFSKIIVACQMTFIYLYLFSWSYRCTISKLESLLWLQQNPLTCLLDSVSKLMGIFVLPFKFGIQWRLLSKLTEIKSIRSILNHTAPCASMLRGHFWFSDDVCYSIAEMLTLYQQKRLSLYTLYKRKLRCHHQKQYHLLYKRLKHFPFQSEDLMLPPCSPVSGICLSDSYKPFYQE